MRNAILSALFALFVCSLSAQVNNIYSNAGIATTVGAPTFRPGAKGSIVAIDTVTGTWYVCRDRYSVNWLSMGDRIETISGCSAPAYTPNKYNSELVINNCAVPELYHHSGGGVWVCLNCAATVTTDATLAGDGSVGAPLKIAQQAATSGQVLKWNGTTWAPAADAGTTYTAGTGIAISGGNVVSNTAPDQTVSIAGAGGNVVTGTYPNFTVTGTPATGAETVVTAGTAISVSGAGTSGSPYIVTNTGDLSATNELNTALLVTGGNLRITDAGGNLDVPVSSIAPVQAVAAGTGISISGTTTRTVSSTITQADGSETVVNAGTGVFVSGVGTSGSPYVVSSSITQYNDESAQDATGAMVGNTLTYTDLTPLLDVKTQMSITSDASGVKLSGDATSPGNSQLYGTNGSGTKGWYAQPAGDGGITTLNGLTPVTQTFSTGTSGTDFAISSATSTHTFNLPTASATNRGALSSADWTTFNNKVSSLWTDAGATTYLTATGDNVAIGTTTANEQLEITKNFRLPPTTASTIGVIMSGADRFAHNYRASASDGFNTFLGVEAGNFTLSPGGGATTLSSYNTGIGYRSLTAITTGLQNTGVGYRSLVSLTTGSKNNAIGFNALAVNTTGSNNNAMGYNALASNTTGGTNTAVGSDVLSNAVSASNLVGVGKSALGSLVSGDGNVAVGVRAANSTNGGGYNVAIGYEPLNLNVTGEYNVAIGIQAAYSLTGSENTIVGESAGYRQTSGTGSTFVGGNAGFGVAASSTGAYNTFLGYKAGYRYTSATNSVMIGREAGDNTSSGATNIMIGYQAGSSTTTGGSNIIIGKQINASGATVSDELRIGSAIYGTTINTGGSAKIGIGVAAPARTLEVSGEVRITDLTTDTPTRLVSADADGDLSSPALSGASFVAGTLTITPEVYSGSFSGVGTATTVFTVTIGTTQANTTYRVNVTPTAVLSAAVFYVTNKTTTTFDVTYLAGLTGTVTFDWSVFP